MQVSLAVLHLGGVTFPWLSGPLRYTMNAAEAIDLCRELGPETILPLHFEGWRHFRQPRDEAVAQLAASPFAERIRWPTAGESVTARGVGRSLRLRPGQREACASSSCSRSWAASSIALWRHSAAR